MSDPPGPAGSAPGSGRPDEQFVVPLPTQALPVAEPTRELPLASPVTPEPPVPPVAPSLYAVQPGWWPTPGAAPPTTSTGATAGGAARAVDPLVGQVGLALFWVTVGWWLFFVVRLLGRIARLGFGDTLVIRAIDTGPEETVVAAVLSVLAAMLLLLGRGRSGRSPLGWAAVALAVVTVVIAIWRLVP
ncbi:hypothetical protein [Terrabacter sp. 2RAF25]|uniref:hypothetical protein n=1 Tax=Terrabacter sp. 2RAF25 TaxID=3232998 RepID=UPI003F9DDF54